MIRPIRPWEMTEVEPLAREFHDLAGEGKVFSPQRLWETLGDMASRNVLAAFALFGKDGTMQGVLLGTLGPQFCTQAAVAQEIMWYVRPEHRRSAESLRLVDLFEEWAKKHGADGIVMASFGATGEAAVARFYERHGYKHLETHYLKHL